ncbi:putative 2OG-Fe(II) oxygenase [Roseateles sp. GG27B]
MTAFNVALAEELTALHTDREAPIDQTLRHGTQTHDNLLAQTWPLVERLKPLLRQAINQYIDELPADASHPFLRRRSKSWRFTGSWSSSLRSSGFHTNHVHTQGWISACYYVAVPPAVLDGGMQAGWIKFGEPDLPLGLVAARSVQPQCGRLVLFPSCFWHGTVPFSDERVRLTVAFDIKPAERVRTFYCAAAMRRWAVLEILNGLKYVPVPALRPPGPLALSYAARYKSFHPFESFRSLAAPSVRGETMGSPAFCKAE